MRVDIIVVGGGPAGAAVASTLAAAGARVVVADGRRAHPSLPEAIAGGAQLALRALGMWEPFLAQRFARSSGKQVRWLHDADIPSIADAYGDAWLVDRRVLDAFLLDQARRAGVTVIEGACRDIATTGRGWEVRIGDRAIHGELIILAQGRHALGPGDSRRTRPPSDDSVAITLVTTLDRADPRLLVERTCVGWWYSIGLPCGRTAIALVVRGRDLPRTTATRRPWWSRQLEATETMPQVARSTAPLRCLSAHGSIRRQIHGDGWCCVGDAAAAYDPLSGQGVSVSLMKGIALARLLSEHPPHRAFDLYEAEERASFDHYTRTRQAFN